MLRARAALLIASVLVAAAARCEPVAAGRPLLVTVDDLPIGTGKLHPDPADRQRITDGLLAVLGQHHVTAVGFVIWGNVAGPSDEALLERWLAAGHDLGNHSRTHLDYSRTAAENYIADVEAGRVGLQAFLDRRGRSIRFFRFPFLREGDTEEKLAAMRAYLERSGQRTAPVTIDDQDWSFEEPWVTASRAGDAAALARIGEEYQLALRSEVLAQTAEGDGLFGRVTPQVLLLHANQVGTAQWDALFTWLEGRGYRFATADEVMADAAIATPHHVVSGPGGSLWYRVRRERGSENARAAVAVLLQQQAAAWSRGDLEGFCSAYADDAVFVSPSGLTEGHQAVLERYRKHYTTPAEMGALTLTVLETREAWGSEANVFKDAMPSRTHGISVVARWALRRADGGESSGLTLLVFHRRDGRWVIVQDASM
jgi:peptidoglycan-N-acetylglucosamine deacetylase